MVRLSRRRALALAGGVTGLALTPLAIDDPLGILPFRPRTTVGGPPTEDRFLIEQPKLSAGDGALFAELLRDEAEVREKTVFASLPETIEPRLRDIEEDEFWTVVGAVLPAEKDLDTGRPRYSHDTLRFPDTVARDDPDLPTNGRSTDPDELRGALRFHYVFQRWIPTVSVTIRPERVVASWKGE